MRYALVNQSHRAEEKLNLGSLQVVGRGGYGDCAGWGLWNRRVWRGQVVSRTPTVLSGRTPLHATGASQKNHGGSAETCFEIKTCTLDFWNTGLGHGYWFAVLPVLLSNYQRLERPCWNDRRAVPSRSHDSRYVSGSQVTTSLT
jgi:hypothetical protein